MTCHCRFCGVRFFEHLLYVRLLTWFCPPCRDLYAVAEESDRRFDAAGVVLRPDDLPHCTIILPNLPTAMAAD